MLVLVALAGLSAVGYVISIAASAPPLDSLKPRDLGSQSEVCAADGTRLGFIQSNELRRPVEGDRIPKSLKDATVAIEDERFYHHKGVDYPGIVRAAVKNLVQPQDGPGRLDDHDAAGPQPLHHQASGPTSARSARPSSPRSSRTSTSKEWILDEYLNTVPYGTVGGQTAVGVQAAARMFFDKPVEELKLHESALLAGLPQAPSARTPRCARREGRGAPQRGAGQDGRARDDHAGRPRRRR